MPRLHPIAVLSLACALALPALADESGARERFLGDSNLKRNILGTAARSTVMTRQPCPAATYNAADPIELRPLKFDEMGSPTAGELKFPVKEEGCGAARLLNVYLWVQHESSIAITPMLPGTSRAEEAQQRNAYPYALQAAGGPEPNCPTAYVSDTLYAGEQGKPGKGARAAPWKEIWTLQSCGWKALVPVLFTPGAGGVTVAAGPRKEVRKEAPDETRM